jgi:TrmH family RNA methyltransferase
MGGFFRIPCVTVAEAELGDWCRAKGVRLLIAAPDGAPPAGERGTPLAVVVGNEGAGTRPSLDGWAQGRIGIPLRAGAESLNVAIAAGILLYEVTRE